MLNVCHILLSFFLLGISSVQLSSTEPVTCWWVTSRNCQSHQA